MILVAPLCRLTQLRAALTADPEARLPRWCQSHLARCARCRELLSAERDLARRLRETAPAARRPAPAHLVARTLARITPAARQQPARPDAAPAWFKPVGALTALCLLLLAGWFLHPPAFSPASTRSAARAEPGRLGPALPMLSAALETDPLHTLAARFEDPLQVELNFVLADLRKVSHSLAATFLPERLSLTSPPEP